jgi:ABC-2 type transport system permease protein
MKAFFTQLMIQFKCDLRDKQTLIIYYMIPLIFFLLVGFVMASIMPDRVNTLMPAFTIFAITMPTFLGLPSTLVRLKEKDVLKAYKAAGIPTWATPLSHAINTCFHTLIVSVIIFALSPIIFGCDLPANIPWYFSKILLVIICSTSLGVMLSSLSKNQGSVTMLGQLLFMPTVLMSGIMFPASMLPKVLQYIGYLFPGTQGMLLMDDGIPFWYPFGGLVLLTGIAVGISLHFYKKTEKQS